jgi:hypothetical protein
MQVPSLCDFQPVQRPPSSHCAIWEPKVAIQLFTIGNPKVCGPPLVSQPEVRRRVFVGEDLDLDATIPEDQMEQKQRISTTGRLILIQLLLAYKPVKH